MLQERRHAAAAERNREPILGVLRGVLPPTGTVLEAVREAAAAQQLGFETRFEMPANNQTLVFRRAATK